MNDTKWFSTINNTVNARGTASWWRWCGHVLAHLAGHKLGVPRIWPAAINVFEATLRLLVEAFALLVVILLLAVAPISIPLVALYNRNTWRREYELIKKSTSTP